MPLILQAVSLNEQPLSQPIAARFDANGGTIGRADHNSMALPDPERHISRVQAEVVAQGGGSSFIIRNLGAANPVFVGNRSLGEGESAPLTPAEPVRIGGYLLRVSMADSESDDRTRAQRAGGSTVVPAGRTAPPPVRPPAVSAPPLPPAPRPPPASATHAASSSDPFADLLGPASSSPASADPFAGLLAPAPAVPVPPPVAAPRSASPPPAPVVPRPPPAMQPPAAPRPAASPADPFADLLGAPSPGPSSDPFADLMPSGPAGVAPGSGAFAAPAAPMAHARLPDDFDPFAAPAPKALPPAGPSDPFADLMPRQSASIDDFMSGGGGGAGGGLGSFGGSGSGGGLGTASADPLAAFMAEAQKPAGGGMPDDPLAMFGAPPAARPQTAPQRDDLHAVHGAFQPPQVLAPSAAPPAALSSPAPGGKPRPAPVAVPPRAAPAAPAAPAPVSAASSGDAALWAALCQGAGLRLPMPADAADRMQALGQILRSAVEGTVQLIALRASTRTELHAAVTMIQSRANNPLKFSPDVQSALEQIVQPAARGFLDGPAAMQDAMTDLVGHAIGTVAGMRAAFEGMLDRFDPTALEARLTGKSPLDSLVPAMRRARLWDLYLEHYKSLREEAQEDFHALFGRAFLAAYEEQVARLKQGGAG